MTLLSRYPFMLRVAHWWLLIKWSSANRPILENIEGYSLAELDNLSWQAKCKSVSVTGRGAMEVIYPETQHLSIISMSYTAIVYRSSEAVMHSLVSADTG